MTSCTMVNGQEEGSLRQYFENGQIQQECYKCRGVENGTLRTWYQDGQLDTMCTMKDGKKRR